MAIDTFSARRPDRWIDVAPAGAPAARSLLDVFAETVSSCGERAALDVPGATLSYSELAAAAAELADRLSSLGIGPGDRVGVRISSGTAELYVGILGVLTAGAAYVPVDADDPAERAATLWQVAEACAVVGDGLEIRELAAACAGRDRDLTVADDAWVIFTSGSTGEPKGVAVTHRSAAAFVDAEARLFRVDPDDRVLAGLSVGFDASCEEMWVAWRHGATLVPAPRVLVRSGEAFGPWLAARGVTAISTVPTLAAMWDEACLAGVRLLILGGEACPEALAWRLAQHREVWNTYGPTEASVVTTAARIHPGEPVTIGWPLAGWQVAVVDGDGEPVPFGEAGELAIHGVGLGRYLDPVLDAKRFTAIDSLGWERAYRSGDIVREKATGLAFVGRRDDQVKLGGRRIELGELDAQLRAVTGVKAAAAAVRESASGTKLLVGYVVGEVDPTHVRAHVAERLPHGIVPLVVKLEALPTVSSGKVDREALPWPPPAPATASFNGTAEHNGRSPVTETRAWLSERWAEQLGPLPISADSDFFELGGTSVAAAKLVSILRSRFPSVAVADVYNHRRLGELATRLDELGEARDETVAAPTARRHRGRALQLAGVFLLLATAAPAWLVGVFAYNDWRGAGPRVAWPWLILAWLIFVSSPGRAMAVVSLRRALLRGLKPGRYPRRSWLALRVWFVERLAEQLHVNRLAGTPWAARMARLAGADVGANVQLGTLPSPAALIRIGDSATLEADVDAHGWWIDGSELVIDELRIGAGARVGARSVLMPGAEIGAGAEIEPGSVVTTAVPAGQRWSGSPARQVGKAGDAWPADAPAPARGRLVSKVMFGAALTLLSLVPLLAAVPALVLLDALGGNWQHVGSTFLVMVTSAPLVAAAFVISEALLIALLVRGASRQLRPGWFGEEGGTACALWLCAQLKEVSRGALFPLYASVYTRPWLRLMGLKIGRRTEVSIADGLNPLVTLGDTSFVADAPMFAAGRARNGWLNLAPIEVGNRTFVGNGAVLTGGTKLGNDCLVGIESNAPVQSAHGTSWFGAPPLELPRVPDRTDPSRTTDPPPRLVLARGATELVRILLPNAVSVVLAALELLALESIAQTAGAWTMMVATPLALACGAVGAALVTVMLKWLLIGRYRRGERPFWSSFVWRDEIINSCQELLAGGWLLNSALGSPLMSPYLRAMGARVGKDVWCETLAITEFDLVTIGDGCAINRGACLETHLVHDRLMRLGPAELGAGSTLGPSSATLPDTVLGAGTSVGARSVVLRGEELPAGTRWHGVPVVRA